MLPSVPDGKLPVAHAFMPLLLLFGNAALYNPGYNRICGRRVAKASKIPLQNSIATRLHDVGVARTFFGKTGAIRRRKTIGAFTPGGSQPAALPAVSAGPIQIRPAVTIGR